MKKATAQGTRPDKYKKTVRSRRTASWKDDIAGEFIAFRCLYGKHSSYLCIYTIPFLKTVVNSQG